jgi:hypothetical protein
MDSDIGAWPGKPEGDTACRFDPLLHPSLPPLDTYVGQEPLIGSPARDAMTATVPYAWMTYDFPGESWTERGSTTRELPWTSGRTSFDEHIIRNEPPGNGPAASSGDCNCNFVSMKWANLQGVLVDTNPPVPVVYLADQRHPVGPYGHPDAVLTVVGSTSLVIYVANREPRKLTFLVVAANTDAKMHIVILNYSEFNLNPASFFEPLPVH